MTISYPVEPAKEFLTAALGADGYQALSKAAERLPSLQAVYVPRAAIAWLQVAQRVGFEGQVPGTQASLQKGDLVVGDARYSLAEDFLRASSALVVDLLDQVKIPEDLDPRQVARLGKSVDALTRARFVARLRELEISTPGHGSESSSASNDGSEESGSSESSPDDQQSDDLSKGIEDMTKGAGWKTDDGVVIPRAGSAERPAWDAKYKQQLADRYAGGNLDKLKAVAVPVTENAFGHFVSDNAGAQPRYRVPTYKKMLAAGDRLPPVFVERLGVANNVFRIIDGNARLKAALQHGKTKELQGYELEKADEMPGQAAKPRGPLKPDAPDAPPAPRTGVAPVPMKPVSRARGFYKSELTSACTRCGQSQMRGRQVVGCLCVCDRLGAGGVVQKNEGDRVVLVGPDDVILAMEDVLGLPPG